MSGLSRENVKTLGYAAAVFAAAGLLYFLTAARDIVVGDTPELITAAATLGGSVRKVLQKERPW